MAVISHRNWARASLFTAAVGMVIPATSEAANYYLHADMSGVTFDNKSLWFDDPIGGNTMAANGDDFAGNSFYSNGFIVRTGTSNYTFGNATTTLYTNSKLLVRAGPDNTITIPNLVRIGTTQIAAGAGHISLNIGNLANDAQTNFTGDGVSSRIITLSIDTLTGASNLSLTQTTRVNLSIGDASGFTGEINWGDSTAGILNFNSPLNSSGGLVALSTSRIELDEDVSFAYVTIDGTTLAPGTYTYSYLKSNFGDIFVDVAEPLQGSITVVPEPAGVMLLGSGALLMLRRRRMA